MNFLRYIIAAICLISISADLHGQPVSIGQAEEIAKIQLVIIDSLNAKAFLKSALLRRKNLSFSDARSITINGDTLCHIFNVSGNNGFIIVSADKRVRPVLGYTLTGNYDEEQQPPAFTDWLYLISSQIAEIRIRNLRAADDYSASWNNLKSTVLIFDSNSVGPLIKTTWDQDCYYNETCPENIYGPCGRTLTGCVATSSAQVMKYWNHPVTGNDSNSYNLATYGKLSANFGATTYQWGQMPNKLTSSNFPVATLMYHLGVSVNMVYGPENSSSGSPRNALVKYFRYSSDAKYVYKSSYTDQNWENLIKEELNASRPVWYSGIGTSGHAFICDGYQNNNYFHFNWGWGGNYDGYFYLNRLNPEGNDFSDNQTAIIRIFPDSLPDAAQPIQGPVALCQGQNSVIYSIPPISNAVSYIWTLPDGAFGNSSSNTISVNFNTSIQSGIIRVRGHNNNGDGPESSLAVTLSPLPLQPGTISGLSAVCQGTTQNYYVANEPGIAYKWTFPAGWSQTGGGTTSSVTVIAGSGSGNITVVPSNSCGNGPSRILSVIVTQLPGQPGSITGPAAVCQGTSLNYYVPGVSGISYNWTFPAGWIQTGGGTTNSVTVTAGSLGGNIAVIPSNGCGTGELSILTVEVSVSLPVQPGEISGQKNVCEGTLQTYSVPLMKGVACNWSFPAGWIQTGGGTTNSVTVTTSSVSGDVTVTPLNGCGSGPPRSVSVTVSPLPGLPAAIAGSSFVCQGSSQIYSVPNLNGVTFKWLFPEGWIQTGGGSSNSVTVTAGFNSGYVSVNLSDGCGNGPARTLQVTTTSLPVQPGLISGPVNVCQGILQTYSVPYTAGIAYKWSFPEGWIQNGGGTSNRVTVTSGSSSGNITVTPSNGCGNGPSRMVSVTTIVSPVQPGEITGSAIVCQGTVQSYSVPAETGLSFFWSFPAGWIQTGGGTTNKVIVTAGSGSGYISVTPTNSCGSGPARTFSVLTSRIAEQPGVVSGNTLVCEGTSQTYSVPEISGVNFNWTFPSGWVQTGGGKTNSVTVTAGSAGGNITITPSNSCGNSISRMLPVAITRLPGQTGKITGSSLVCAGSSQIYSVPGMDGINFNWTFPSGWVQTGGAKTNSVTVIAGSLGGNITVAPSNSCGNGATEILPVTAISQPENMGTISGSALVCQGTSQFYSVPEKPGVTYNWSFPSDWVQTGGGTTNAVSVKAGSNNGYISVTPANVCGKGPISMKSVLTSSIPVQSGEIAGPDKVCQGSIQIYAVPGADGINYNWSFPAGWLHTGGGTTNSVTVTAGSSGGFITVSPSNFCGNGNSSKLNVAANPVPSIPKITQNGKILTSDSPAGNQWYNSSGIINGATSQNLTARSHDYYYVTVNREGCVSQPSPVLYVIIDQSVFQDDTKKISIYPNPVKNHLIIETAGYSDPLEFEIINLIGQTIYNSKVETRQEVNMENFPDGQYFIRFKSDNEFIYKKLIKI